MKNYKGKVNIGTYTLDVNMKADHSNNNHITIVFENGYGATYDYWSEVQTKLARKYDTLAYNRAGVGTSDDPNLNKNSITQVHELNKLLNEVGVTSNVVIVAHSIVGHNARIFASEYKNAVAGLVLVDCSHEDQNKLLLESATPEFKEMYKSQFTLEGSLEDMLESDNQARLTREHIVDLPLTVISATEHGGGEEMEKMWLNLQKDLASLSTNSRFVIAEECGHGVPEEQPNVVIDAVSEIIERIL